VNMIILNKLPQFLFNLRRPILGVGIFDFKVQIVLRSVCAEHLFKRRDSDAFVTVAILALQIPKPVTGIQLLQICQ